MSASLTDSSPQDSSKFQFILDSFLSTTGLSFSKSLSADRIESASLFRKDYMERMAFTRLRSYFGRL